MTYKFADPVLMNHRLLLCDAVVRGTTTTTAQLSGVIIATVCRLRLLFRLLLKLRPSQRIRRISHFNLILPIQAHTSIERLKSI
jgi:hypothetical protein